KVSIMSCNEEQLPNGIWTGLHQHSRQLTVLNMQLNVSKPNRKRIWQKIVQQKIMNQAKCLLYLDKDGSNVVESIAKSVESGDKTNRDSYAAIISFSILLENGFTRRMDHPIKRMLNYGYALM